MDTGSTAPPIGKYTAAETALYGSYVHRASAESLRGFTIISLIIIAQELQFILSIPTSTQFSSAFKMGPTLRLSRNLFNPLNAELSPICYLLALLGAHHFLHVSRIRIKSLTLRQLMLYIYGAPILDVSRSHTTTHHSR